MDTARFRLASTAVVVVAAALFAAVRAPVVSLPLERDEGEYAYIAQRMAAGEVPYRDAFDQKPPGVFLAYRLAFAAFDPSIESIHGVAFLWSAATGLALFALVARLAGSLAGAFALLVFALASADPRIVATAANTETFMLLPLVTSVYCLVRALEGGRLAWWGACGFLTAAAVVFKQVAAANVLLVAAALALGPRARPLAAHLLRSGGAWLLGAVLALAPVLLYFAARGAWQPFVDSVLLHNLAYAQRVPIGAGATVLLGRLVEQAPSFAVFWLLALAAALRPASVPLRRRALWIGFAACSALGTSIGLYFRPHYFVQLVPALAGLSGASLGAIGAWMLRGSQLRAAAGVAALVLLAAAPSVWANRAVLGAGSPGAISRMIYGFNPFPESLRIAEYIQRTSAPEDRVFVLGSEPQILFYAQRRSATRYIFMYPMTSGYPDSLERQREAFDEVVAADPLYVVWVNVHTSLLIAENSEHFLFKQTSRWLDERYAFEFLVRPDPDGGTPALSVGDRGRRILDDLDEDLAGAAWVAVFRRR